MGDGEAGPEILYKDRLFIVLNKPAGLPVHPGPSGGPTVEDWFPQLCFEHPRPPALAHRLDRDTAGCLLLGRSQKALSRLGKMFQNHRIEKVYWAVVRGWPAEEAGTITLPLYKHHSEGKGWRVVVDRQQGQSAQTDWRVLGRSADGCLAWIECRPRSGRTHQIRVHCQVMGWPLLGDLLYGSALDRAPEPALGLHLLARSLSIPAPIESDRPPVFVEAPVPRHMQAALRACGWQEEAQKP